MNALVAFCLALDVAMITWALISLCVKLHISRSEVLFGKAEVQTTLRVEVAVLISSIFALSWFIFSELNL